MLRHSCSDPGVRSPQRVGCGCWSSSSVVYSTSKSTIAHPQRVAASRHDHYTVALCNCIVWFVSAAKYPARVEFFFDVMCPWAYQASKWIRDVRSQTGLEIDWRFFSLEEVNLDEGKRHPWERGWSYGWSMLRIAAWLRRKDPSLVDSWYAAAGKALHEDGRKPFLPDGAKQVVGEAGLPAETVDAAIADEATHDDVRDDHRRLVRDHAGFGVPTLVFPNGEAVYGPVVVPAPTGEAALRLWELTVGWTELPHLYEMRKPKTGRDLGHIGTHFLPYLQARQWQTVERPAD